MGPSSAFLGVLFLSGTLGLTTSPARGRLRCYTCSFAKPCDPVPRECREDESKRRRKSLSGKAASPEPSALCWAMRPTGHGPTLSGTSAVSRTYAMLPPHSHPPTFPS
ncbi:lymphocyte antigen 6G6e isoform b precursor [Mus musculus]|uniref:Lymphocyte antigen 6 family member G6E n=1 Tax=Mus musculus TaxID=10090 RepID=G3UXD4_MOUSE|nr:lymphocyte antigen 6G6e isoform b precursor [Mus musculus]